MVPLYASSIAGDDKSARCSPDKSKGTKCRFGNPFVGFFLITEYQSEDSPSLFANSHFREMSDILSMRLANFSDKHKFSGKMSNIFLDDSHRYHERVRYG
jgi:hypothetical protein